MSHFNQRETLRRWRRLAAGAAVASVAIVAFMLISGCSINDLRVAAIRNPFPESDKVVAGTLHEPDALRADLD